LQIGIDAGKKVMAEAVPYCMMKGYEKYISENYIPETEILCGKRHIKSYTEKRTKEDKSKLKQCKECKYDTVCEGPWKEYPQKKGDSEFKAVK